MELNTKFLGKSFEHYEIIDSTQAEVWRRIEKNNVKNGNLIIADIQTNGIGTHGRIWKTDEKNNIAFSFAIKTDCNISKLNGITKEVAEVLLQVFKNLYNVEIKIKEPNDLIINEKKVGGILCQTKLKGEIVNYIVIGIGINTNKIYFSDDIKEIATSIKKEFNVNVNNEEVIKEFCSLFEEKLVKRIGGV